MQKVYTQKFLTIILESSPRLPLAFFKVKEIIRKNIY